MQHITVQNKGQFIAAIECARDCASDTEIRISGLSTVFTVYGNHIPDPQTKRPIDIENYHARKKASSAPITKLKGKARKLKASVLKGR